MPTRELTTATLTEGLVRASLDAAADAERIRRPVGRALFDYLARLEAGRPARPELPDAAAAALLDRDDLHWPSVTHPGAAIDRRVPKRCTWTIYKSVEAIPPEAYERIGLTKPDGA